MARVGRSTAHEHVRRATPTDTSSTRRAGENHSEPLIVDPIGQLLLIVEAILEDVVVALEHAQIDCVRERARIAE